MLGAGGDRLMRSTRRKTTRRPSLRRTKRKRPLFGCGVDVVELPRFRQALKRGGEAFMRRVFTKHEAAYARARRRTTLLHLAGRFAAKEAVIKAVSQVDAGRMLAMNQVEVRNDRLGRPHVRLHDRRQARPGDRKRRAGGRLQIHISLSHVDTVAVASAIVMR